MSEYTACLEASHAVAAAATYLVPSTPGASAPQVNAKISKTTHLKEMNFEIEKLKQMLIATREKNGAAAFTQVQAEEQACFARDMQRVRDARRAACSASGMARQPITYAWSVLAMQACMCRRSSTRRSARSGASWQPAWRSWR